MIPTVCSAQRAKTLKWKFDAVITLEDPDEVVSRTVRFFRKPHPPHLILAFDDITDPADGAAPEPGHLEQAIGFGRTHRGKRVLVHCRMGVARSAATAITLAADAFGPGREAEAVDAVFAAYPWIKPNPLMVRHADALLKCDGRLIEAVARSRGRQLVK